MLGNGSNGRRGCGPCEKLPEKLFGPDFMKLDMQLIRGVASDPYKAVVASKILEMAQSLEVETIVEGVETEKELVGVGP